jgi:hypothetical protein
MKNFAAMATLMVVVTITGCVSAPQNAPQTSNIGYPSTGTMAGQISNMGSAAGMGGNVLGGSTMSTQAPSLINILVQQLGITPQQATGGAGSIFSMAQQSMSPNKFSLIGNAVPGMSKYLAAAPSMSASNSGGGGLLGAAASVLGGGSSLGNMAMLANSFQSLGLSSGMMGQFIPIILQYVQTQGGSSTMGLLQGALMP